VSAGGVVLQSEGPSLEVYTAFSVYLDHDEQALLGLLTVLWSQVEFCVEMGVYHFKGLTFEDGRSQKVLKRDVSKQLEQLRALTGDKCEREKRLAFASLIDRAADLALGRNLAVHGHWVRLMDHGDAVAAVSWRYVAVGDEIERLGADQLRPMCIEAGLIAKGLHELLDGEGAFAFMAK
jgi:hypothetical protein